MTRSTLAAMALVLGGCSDVTSVPLLGDATYPEGIAAHPHTHELFVGGVANGDIQRIDAEREVTFFKEAHEDGLLNVIGLAVDPERDRLFVCSTSFFDPTVAPSLVVFDTVTGHRLASLSAPADGLPHFFNDVTVDSTGRAYVTDSFAPIVYTVDVDLTGLDVLATDPAFLLDPLGFNLNGIAVTPDDRYAIASVATLSETGQLFRIDLDDGTVLPLATPASFPGVDGLLTVGSHTMLGIGGRPQVQRFRFTDDFDAVDITAFPESAEFLDFPTTAARLGSRIHVVNSQLDHFVPGQPAFGTDPELPFEVVGVSSRLLR
ncbi:MAG: SMP-30/gluconolactonase/LRE family protein [Myxococcales bacterium]|nr:SMP-30/gluconolactonase/LRE family protein [Myxococcales bacterium]